MILCRKYIADIARSYTPLFCRIGAYLSYLKVTSVQICLMLYYWFVFVFCKFQHPGDSLVFREAGRLTKVRKAHIKPGAAGKYTVDG